jgi:hypothetical protein
MNTRNVFRFDSAETAHFVRRIIYQKARGRFCFCAARGYKKLTGAPDLCERAGCNYCWCAAGHQLAGMDARSFNNSRNNKTKIIDVVSLNHFAACAALFSLCRHGQFIWPDPRHLLSLWLSGARAIVLRRRDRWNSTACVPRSQLPSALAPPTLHAHPVSVARARHPERERLQLFLKG